MPSPLCQARRFNPQPPMTILQYITPSRMGGAEEYFLRLVVHLRAQGHRVIVVTKRDTPLRHELEKRVASHGIELFAWHTRGKFDAITLSKLVKLIRRERVDLVHTHLTTASWNGNIAARICRVPAVAHVHAADSKTWFQWAHYQIAVARGVKAHLVAQGVKPRQIPVLYYGLDLSPHRVLELRDAKAQIGVPRDAPVVGVVASLIERKGHRFLLEAIAGSTQLRNLHAVFAGEGALLETLKEQVRVLELGNRVHFLGFCNDAKNVMAACDVVALPSLKEGLSIAVMEAMSLPRAVIATDIAGMPELVRDGETGRLIPPNDIDALRLALEDLITDDELRNRLALQGRAWLEEHFDQRKCLAEVEAFLVEVVENWRQGARVDCTDR